MKKIAFIYMMSNKHGNVLYIGVTSNLRKRAYEHRHHLLEKSFTDVYNLEYLVYYEHYESVALAIEREKQLKKWTRAKKDALIAIRNPSRRDLYSEIQEEVYSLI
ncbi:GIY-YIG nuclease family protein [Ravibacter arvi]|uniref:GIY-YIG nuclease family protein n=1 Tax=Ravibacter arvi TaxID=2051041 RepID=A0ABP8M207_9BACT